jgi:hypothetical protein
LSRACMVEDGPVGEGLVFISLTRLAHMFY